MTTQPLNLCRQFAKFVFGAAQELKNQMGRRDVQNFVALMGHCLKNIEQSQKFILPVGGRLFEDPEFRGIDDDEQLRLPFKFVVLEYLREPRRTGPTEAQPHTASKTIVLVREMDKPSGLPPLGMVAPRLGVLPINWIVELGIWVPQPEYAICGIGPVVNGRRTFLAGPSDAALGIPPEDYEDEIGAVVSFISALSCSNVGISNVANRALTSKQVRAGALQFDEYKVLTIRAEDHGQKSVRVGGQHASPREHLRRGHIRRVGHRRIWVNSCVVNPAVGGKVTKDYVLRAHP